jgi:hypothetical protein
VEGIAQNQRDQRRDFVRQTAEKIAVLASVQLDVEHAPVLVSSFADLLKLASDSQVNFYVPLLEACQSLAQVLSREKLSTKQLLTIVELLQESITCIQASLFSYALQGLTTKDKNQFERICQRSQVFLEACNPPGHNNRADRPQTMGQNSKMNIPKLTVSGPHSSVQTIPSGSTLQSFSTTLHFPRGGLRPVSKDY